DSGLIHEVSHAEIIHADDIPRFAELNIAAEMCPILWYPIPGLNWEMWLGPHRSKVWPVKTLVESGALVIYGSDWPVVPTANPWPGIESMVTRSDPSGANNKQDWPEQAVDLATTIRIFTHNGAIANKAGQRSGSLEVGKDADFIVLDRNIFEVPISDVGETVILMSIVGGKTIVNKL
ncbi:MAG: amidohydrolase family protein, partial [Gammaproteobacteria bacterium]|nr:amidohydrolase family protein [Gammaproteobacteria bacterium]